MPQRPSEISLRIIEEQAAMMQDWKRGVTTAEWV